MTRLPPAAVKALARGVPADKVLMPHVQLTAKQKALVQAIASGATKREAYLATHNPRTSNSRTLSMMASRAAASDNVQIALSQQQAVERLRYSQNPLQIREFVVDSLQHEARTAQKPADRLRALELLGKLADVGAFETRSVITHRTDSRDALRAKLARLAAIEVEVTETPTVPPPPQTDRLAVGASPSTNPHQQSTKVTDPQPELSSRYDSTDEVSSRYDSELSSRYDTPGYENGVEEVKEEESVDTTPLEKEVGSHRKGGKKKDRPIWEDPKRWYKEVLGELPKPIEEMPLEEARRLIQEKLK